MKKQTNSFLAVMACFLVFLSCACDPCDGEPGAIAIDVADRTAPELYWQVVTRTSTPSGPISSLTLLTDPSASVAMTHNDVVEITLFAEDNESGVKWVDLQGGFGYICGNANGAVALDGIIEGDRVFYDFAGGECAIAEAEYPVFIIDGSNLCFPAFPNLSSGGYELLGSSANSNDFIRQNFRLLVNIVTPASS